MWLWLTMTLLCFAMAAAPQPLAHAEDRDQERLAVLETRANQIDNHLSTTDATVTRLTASVESQGNQISEMIGEMRMAFAALGLLTGGNFFFQVRKGKKGDG